MNTHGLHAFLRKWRSALGKTSVKAQFWEGPRAYSELMSLELLDRVRLEEQDTSGPSNLKHFIAQHALPIFAAEFRKYKQNLGRIRDRREREKYLGDWLGQQSREFQKKAERVRPHFPEVSKDLLRYAHEFEGQRRVLKRGDPRVWHSPLLLRANYRAVPLQERELDSGFQIRLALSFRKFMQKESGLSLRTVARLVVLLLVYADLAEPQVGNIKLHHNRRLVSVDTVIQHLRRAGVK
jgi:hypothetical protein